jgi:hypothetical protein
MAANGSASVRVVAHRSNGSNVAIAVAKEFPDMIAVKTPAVVSIQMKIIPAAFVVARPLFQNAFHLPRGANRIHCWVAKKWYRGRQNGFVLASREVPGEARNYFQPMP